ncbi:MAG: hypothetical protein PW735_08435 [Acidobacteriaceae bacterium]|nr:hypothetical protein [Acidobacteriaceae bacterium]
MKISCRSAVWALTLISTCSAAFAQKVYTDHDYAQAERWMGYNVAALVHGTVSHMSYLPDGRVFFRENTAQGNRYWIADPKTGEKKCPRLMPPALPLL